VKRVGGGTAQMNLVSFAGLAETIVPHANGKDARSGSGLLGREAYLSRVFNEFGWRSPKRVVLIAAVRRDIGQDGFMPLAPLRIDIEAGQHPEGEEGHRELQVVGGVSSPDEEFLQLVDGFVGVATEYGDKQDSIEFVLPVYTPGQWQAIEDREGPKFGTARQTGIIIVTPYDTLWCPEMDVNNLVGVGAQLSVKTAEAVKIARHVLSLL